MDRKDKKFLKFLESLKNEENAPVLESIVKGFGVLVESEQKPSMSGISGTYKGTPVDISVTIQDVQVDDVPEIRGSRDSLGVPLEPDEGGLELEDYTATALLQPLDENYEPVGNPVTIPHTEFAQVSIEELAFSDNPHNRRATDLETLVTEYIRDHIERWAPGPDDDYDPDYGYDDY